jgi:hypothetical protein
VYGYKREGVVAEGGLTGHSADLRGWESGGVHVCYSAWSEVVVLVLGEIVMVVFVVAENGLLVEVAVRGDQSSNPRSIQSVIDGGDKSGQSGEDEAHGQCGVLKHRCDRSVALPCASLRDAVVLSARCGV